MNNNFSPDNPVTFENEDKFQRYSFAKRISESIINNTSNDCITYGIYGEWGEGKSSVINFIEKELKSNKVLTYKYNPWRFSDESTMIVQFFNSLAKIYDESLIGPGDKISDFFTRYSDVIAAIPKVGGILSAFIPKKPNTENLDKLRANIEEILKLQKIKIVIFVDDIDRLDKDEIFTILRLVKLTGNFPNLVYILAFDEKMVAQALSNRFGIGDSNSGSDFLEKIIQVPLHIPAAQPEMISNFCFDQIDKSLSISRATLNDFEIQRFRIAFSDLLPTITTPRLAIRVANSIAFTLPMIYGEVNTVDLMLIESIKVLFPNHFELIRDKRHYFLNNIKSYYFTGDKTKRKQLIKEEFNQLNSKYSAEQITGLERVLIELFPFIGDVFADDGHILKDINGLEAELNNEKRIGSKNYFKRYFSYTILKGEISDIDFEIFIANIDTFSEQQLIDKLIYFKNISSEGLLLEKIGYIYNKLSWHHIKQLLLALINIEFDDIEINLNIFSLTSNAYTNVSILIYKILKHNENEVDLFEFVKLLMANPPLLFALEINYWIRTGKSMDDKLFKTNEEYNTLARTLIDRTILEPEISTLFENYPLYIVYIFSSWKEINNDEFTIYLKSKLESNPEIVIPLIKAFTPRLTSSINPKPYLGDLKKDGYDNLVYLMDKEYLFRILKLYDEKIVDKYKDPVWTNMNDGQTDENLINQFLYWYYDKPITNESE